MELIFKMTCCTFAFLHILPVERLIAAHERWQRLLSARVSMWTESHKIYKAWVFINQVLTRCFLSNGVWLISQIIKSVWVSESVNINKSIWMDQFYPMETSNFIVVQYLQLTWEEFAIRSKKREIWAVSCVIIKLLMVI